jgi:hypothetical protein
MLTQDAPKVVRTQIEAFWTLQDVTRFLRVSAKEVRRYYSEGQLPHMLLGPKTLRFEPEKVRAWARAHEVQNEK